MPEQRDNLLKAIVEETGDRIFIQPDKNDMVLYRLKAPVFFIGFMGAGKTTISRRLARVCRLACIDLDGYIERREGMTCSQIFADCGEPRFREIETDVLREFAYEGDPMIVSCGGGVIKTKESREILKDAGFVVYLQVDADEAKERIGDTSSRPLFQNIMNARRTNEERKTLYLECADAWIATNGKSVWQITNEVQDTLIKAGVLCPVTE